MKIAVTGGTGFIGRALVERLLGSGHEVLVLTRRPAEKSGPSGIRTAHFEALSDVPAKGLLADIEAVFNLAGEPVARRWTPDQKERVLRSRVQGTVAIVRAAKEAGSVKALLNASAIGIYGTHGPEVFTEESPLGSDFL